MYVYVKVCVNVKLLFLIVDHEISSGEGPSCRLRLLVNTFLSDSILNGDQHPQKQQIQHLRSCSTATSDIDSRRKFNWGPFNVQS